MDAGAGAKFQFVASSGRDFGIIHGQMLTRHICALSEETVKTIPPNAECVSLRTDCDDGEVRTFSYKSRCLDEVIGAKPIALLFNGEAYPLDGKWKNLPMQAGIAIEKCSPGKLREIALKNLVTGLSASASGLRRGQYVPDADVWYEMNASARKFVRQLRDICRAVGVDLSQVQITYVAGGLSRAAHGAREGELECRVLPSPALSAAEMADVNAFAADVGENYADGFDFRETSRRLVEGRVGKAMTEAVAKALQARMFERGDGVWLLPEMVMDDAARVKMTARAKELLANEGAFALDALRDEFEGAIRNIPSGADFKRFFNAFVADAVGGRVRGHEGWRVCFAAGTSEAAGWAAIADRVRDVLASAGDALSIADILAQLPHLDREVA